MRAKPFNPAIVSLFAILVSGCASQNAMTMLPEDVRLSVLAENARSADPAGDGMSDNLPTDDGRSAASLSAEEKAFRLRQAAPDRFSAAADAPEAPVEETDPAVLFKLAMEQRTNAQPMIQSDETAETSPEPDATEIWNQMMAMRNEGAAPAEPGVQLADAIDAAPTGPVAGIDETIKTAAIDEPASVDPASIVTLMLDARTFTLSKDDEVRLALKRSGGRVASRIIVGRLEGAGAEVLTAARDLGDTVAELTGAEPGISYDPTLDVATVRIEYAPLANTGSRS